MTPERYQQIKALFHAALEREPGERAGFLDEACAGDPSLRAEVESLIASDERAGSFIGAPAFQLAAGLIADGQGELVEGKRIGPYKILGEIGRGGMGAVYLAARADEQYQKQVAIKLIKRGMDTDFVIHHFRHERQILANLDHLNIARLLDGGATEDGLPYFVMEYIEGQPIDQYCDAHKLSTVERLKLFRHVCSAVEYAHRNLVIHRDLKPGNILVTADGVPKLLDFGIAKLLNPELSSPASDPTATVLRLMTPDYASPEQVRGEAIITTSDVYSLGVLLYELLTGHRPYRLKGRLPHEILQAVCEQEPEKPSTAVTRVEEALSTDGQTRITLTPESVSQTREGQPDKLRRRLSGDLDTIVLMAMRKEPQRRYASVEQFSEDIRRHLEGLPVIVRKDTFTYRSGKFIERHKAGVAAVSLIFLTLLVGIVATVWQARIAAEQRDKARVETAKAERINAFLQDTLGFANPSWYSPNTQKGRDVTIADALDEAARRVDSGELADQPEVRAEMQRTIGNTYQTQARYDLAEHHLRAALETYRRLYGEEHPEVARSLNFLAEVLTLKGDYAGAEPLFQKALAIYRQKYADGSVPASWFVGPLGDLGLLKLTKGEIAAAEPLFREALQFSPKLVGNERAQVAIVLGNLGRVREAQGDLNEAESLYRNSIQEYRQLPGRERMELAVSLTYLGDLLKTKGQYQEAEPVLREGLDVARKLVGEKSPYLCITLNSLGHLLYLKGDYAQAEAEVSRALEIFRQTIPEGHIGFAGPLTTLGLIMNKTGRSAQAESKLREALKIRTRVLPKRHWQIAFTQGALGECLSTQKRYAEAEPLLIESYTDMRSSQGEQNPRTAEARQRLVKLYEAWGKPDQAAQYRARLPQKQ